MVEIFMPVESYDENEILLTKYEFLIDTQKYYIDCRDYSPEPTEFNWVFFEK